MGNHLRLMQTIRCRSANQANSAFHPFGVDNWLVSSNQMPSISVRGGAIWWTLEKQKAGVAKLRDPCLNALWVLTWHYISIVYTVSLCCPAWQTASWYDVIAVCEWPNIKDAVCLFCLYAGARALSKKLTVKPRSEHIQREPAWKARLKKQIKELRANLNKLQ